MSKLSVSFPIYFSILELAVLLSSVSFFNLQMEENAISFESKIDLLNEFNPVKKTLLPHLVDIKNKY